MENSQIILASGSKSRQEMLKNASVDFDIMPADIDEESIIHKMEKGNNAVEDIALTLAQKKSLSIDNNEKYIIGSDQILSLRNKLFSKAKNKEEAKEKLLQFSGETHQLTSSVCVAKNNKIIWHETKTAHLTMKKLSVEFIDQYIAQAGDDIYDCVGCYALERTGVRLFQEIEGDYFTILGMPLLPLLNFLEGEGLLP